MRIVFAIAVVLTLALTSSASAQNACYQHCYDRRGDLEQRARRADEDVRRADRQYRRADTAYNFARAGDRAAPFVLNRVEPGTGYVYRGTRELMDSRPQQFRRRETPREECEAFPSVSGALRCRR